MIVVFSGLEVGMHARRQALRFGQALPRRARSEHFSPEEILEIVAVVVNMNVWTRIKLAAGATPGPA